MDSDGKLSSFRIDRPVKPSEVIRGAMSFRYDDAGFPGYYDAANDCYSVSGQFFERLADYIDFYYDEAEEAYGD